MEEEKEVTNLEDQQPIDPVALGVPDTIDLRHF